MTVTSHLKSLQAVELAVREGSLKQAAEKLNITPAAVGQRIRALEDYLGKDLLMRGRSGLKPTAELEYALGDLQSAFAALDRVTDTLDFQRVTEIHIVADSDWADLWLAPRLDSFKCEYPNILFCVNGSGDVPVRLGTPDIRVFCSEDVSGDALYTDYVVPVTGLDNTRRIANKDPSEQMEGMPLLHLKNQPERRDYPGWMQWFEAFGGRTSGRDQGVHYNQVTVALEAVQLNVGFFICGLSLMTEDLAEGTVVAPFSLSQHIVAPHPYRISVQSDVTNRPQVQRFISWLTQEAQQTQRTLDEQVLSSSRS